MVEIEQSEEGYRLTFKDPGWKPFMVLASSATELATAMLHYAAERHDACRCPVCRRHAGLAGKPIPDERTAGNLG